MSISKKYILFCFAIIVLISCVGKIEKTEEGKSTEEMYLKRLIKGLDVNLIWSFNFFERVDALFFHSSCVCDNFVVTRDENNIYFIDIETGKPITYFQDKPPSAFSYCATFETKEWRNSVVIPSSAGISAILCDEQKLYWSLPITPTSPILSYVWNGERGIVLTSDSKLYIIRDDGKIKVQRDLVQTMHCPKVKDNKVFVLSGNTLYIFDLEGNEVLTKNFDVKPKYSKYLFEAEILVEEGKKGEIKDGISIFGYCPDVVDVDGDGEWEIVVPAHDRIYLLNGKGEIIWMKEFSVDYDPLIFPLSISVDCDGYKDIIAFFSGFSGYIAALSGKDGEILWDETYYPLFLFPFPISHDINNDGIDEIIIQDPLCGIGVLDRFGNIYCDMKIKPPFFSIPFVFNDNKILVSDESGIFLLSINMR